MSKHGQVILKTCSRRSLADSYRTTGCSFQPARGSRRSREISGGARPQKVKSGGGCWRRGYGGGATGAGRQVGRVGGVEGAVQFVLREGRGQPDSPSPGKDVMDVISHCNYIRHPLKLTDFNKEGELVRHRPHGLASINTCHLVKSLEVTTCNE